MNLPVIHINISEIPNLISRGSNCYVWTVRKPEKGVNSILCEDQEERWFLTPQLDSEETTVIAEVYFTVTECVEPVSTCDHVF